MFPTVRRGLSVGHLHNYVRATSWPLQTDADQRAASNGWDAFGLPAENEALTKARIERDGAALRANFKRN